MHGLSIFEADTPSASSNLLDHFSFDAERAPQMWGSTELCGEHLRASVVINYSGYNSDHIVSCEALQAVRHREFSGMDRSRFVKRVGVASRSHSVAS